MIIPRTVCMTATVLAFPCGDSSPYPRVVWVTKEKYKYCLNWEIYDLFAVSQTLPISQYINAQDIATKQTTPIKIMMRTIRPLFSRKCKIRSFGG